MAVPREILTECLARARERLLRLEDEVSKQKRFVAELVTTIRDFDSGASSR